MKPTILLIIRNDAYHLKLKFSVGFARTKVLDAVEASEDVEHIRTAYRKKCVVK